jgi:Family of unknown function (DUF5372)
MIVGVCRLIANHLHLAFFESIPEVRVLPSTGITRLQRSYDPVRLPPMPPPEATLRPLPSHQAGLPRLPEPPFRRAVPTTPADRAGAHVDCFPASRGLPPKGVHNAGRLTYEVMITYPFYPLVGQSVHVVGDKEHGGTRYLIICNGDGARLLLPEWMTFPEAGAIQTLSRPRLSVTRLVELRALIDRLMALSPGSQLPGGGQSNEAMEATPTRPVHDTTAQRPTANSTNDRNEAAQDASGRGDLRCTEKRKDAHSRDRQ